MTMGPQLHIRTRPKSYDAGNHGRASILVMSDRPFRAESTPPCVSLRSGEHVTYATSPQAHCGEGVR